MRDVVIFEPDSSGHRMVFVRYIAEAMARHGGFRALLVTTRQAVEAPWIQEMQKRLDPHLSFCVVDIPGPSGGALRLPAKFERQFRYTHALKSAVRELRSHGRVDHVLVPFLDDYCLFPFAWETDPFDTVSWSGIAIRPRFHFRGVGASVPRRKGDFAERWAYRRLLRSPSLGTVFCIDPTFAPSLDDTRLVTVDDPADIADEVADRSWLPVAPDAVVLLVYGHIDKRKAVDRLLDVAADARVPRNLVVSLVGPQDEGLLPAIRSVGANALRANGRLVEIARRVSDAEEAAAFARADIVWGYYPGNYCSSGAMVRAGQMARPLMATEEGLVGLLTRQNNSGLTAPEHDDEALLQQLLRLAGDADLRRALGSAGQRYFGSATGMKFGDQIVGRLATACDRS